MLRILCIGDIVGKPGRAAVRHALPELCREHEIDFVVANGENAAAGSCITPKIFRELRSYGVDVVTMGDHAFKRREALPLYETEDRILRPANWPAAAPGRGATIVETKAGRRIGVIHLQGKAFMDGQGDFLLAADREIERMGTQVDAIVVDMHAEATSEKIALSWHLDGRVSLIFGTHTHVPTADACIRPRGTAYITDCGMTGPYAGVIGRSKDAVLTKMRTHVHNPFEVAVGDVRIGAVVCVLEDRRGPAVSVQGIWRPVAEAEHES